MEIFNIQKEEKKAYKQIVEALKKTGISQVEQEEILDLVYKWSELAIELEQRSNQ